MILLKYNIANDVVVTLTEKETTFVPLQFIFVFSSGNKGKKYATATTNDESLYPERYNKFTITQSNSPNLIDGEIKLGEDGFYSYTIYGIDQVLDLQELIALIGMTWAEITALYNVVILETGKMRYVKSPEAKVEYNAAPENKTIFQNL